MDKYINATALLEQMPEVPYKGSVRRILMQAPAADVAPVRPGRWVPVMTSDYKGEPKQACEEIYSEWYKCSVCGKESFNWNYCPNCGAEMQKGDK